MDENMQHRVLRYLRTETAWLIHGCIEDCKRHPRYWGTIPVFGFREGKPFRVMLDPEHFFIHHFQPKLELGPDYYF